MPSDTPVTRLVDADVIRQHLIEAELSQRSAARALRIDERTMRRYCAGDLPVPPYVIFALMQISQMRRNTKVATLLDQMQLSTGDGPITKERLLENSEKLRRAAEYAIGHASQLECDRQTSAAR